MYKQQIRINNEPSNMKGIGISPLNIVKFIQSRGKRFIFINQNQKIHMTFRDFPQEAQRRAKYFSRLIVIPIILWR